MNHRMRIFEAHIVLSWEQYTNIQRHRCKWVEQVYYVSDVRDAPFKLRLRMADLTQLTIIIPTRNRRFLLQRAIESVFAQRYSLYRVIVIDDGSEDDTERYLGSVKDPRLQVIRHESSKGVNAARNAGYKTLREGDWAVPLDDDDYFLPGAFEIIARTIEQVPADVPILQFPTVIETRDETYDGHGVAFSAGQHFIEPTYEEIMQNFNFGGRGESRMALKWTLFPKYLFNEDVNGFEGEWWLLVSRDGLRNRFVNTPPIVHIDWLHQGEHLSDTAARGNPGSFARAHKRIMHDHAAFLATHPALLRERSVVGFKVAVRAFDPFLVAYFCAQYMKATWQLATRKISWH